MSRFLCFLFGFVLIVQIESARILAVFPTPGISNQGVHRSIIHELLNRNHEVVLITPVPEYTKGQSPVNLMEIDVSNVTKEIWTEIFVKDSTGQNKYTRGDLKGILQVAARAVEKQFQIPEIKSFIGNNETFDLLLLDAWIRPVLFWTYVFDAPVIAISSSLNDYLLFSGPTNVVPYSSYHNAISKLNFWNRIMSLYDYWKLDSMYSSLEKEENRMARQLFGKVPPLKVQMERIEMVLLDVHPVWQGARPLPMNVVQLGGTQIQDQDNRTEITEELKQYLDSQSYGVIFVNFGADMATCLPEHTKNMLIRAFGDLQCAVLWKWDEDIKELPKNVRVGHFESHAAILKHPNTHLYITQCEQQYIDEAIAAAVPILAVPLASYQWRNAELVTRHQVGSVLNIEKMKGEELKNIIESTMRNASYFINMQRMQSLYLDAPASAPTRAANAIEYVIRNTAAAITSPSSQIHWYQYMEIELIIIVIIVVCIWLCILGVMAYCIVILVKRYRKRKLQKKDNYKNKV